MKVIDLLNKIANGEEVQKKKIKYKDKIYIAKGNAIEGFVDYCSDEDEWCFNHYVRYENLNDTVEIIEEEKKTPEKLNTLTYDVMCDILGLKHTKYQEEATTKLYKHIINEDEKINDIIDYLQYLKNKGE